MTLETHIKLVAMMCQTYSLMYGVNHAVYLTGGVMHAVWPFYEERKAEFEKVFMDHPAKERMAGISVQVFRESPTLDGLMTLSE